jgi:EthD domain
MMVASATIAAGERELPDELHARITHTLLAEGVGERAVFDREASSARAFAWLYRSAASVERVEELLAQIPGVADLAIYAVDATDVHGLGYAEPPANAPGQEQVAPGVRKIAFTRRRADVTSEYYIRRYHEHGAVAEVHHSNASRYRQNVVTRYIGPPERAADGVSEHWYASVDDALEHHFARPDSQEFVTADIEGWIDPSTAIGGYAHVWHWS